MSETSAFEGKAADIYDIWVNHESGELRSGRLIRLIAKALEEAAEAERGTLSGKVLAAIDDAAATFREYQDHHRNKLHEGEVRVQRMERNDRMATRLEAVAASIRGENDNA